jgi:hypothetical protein
MNASSKLHPRFQSSVVISGLWDWTSQPLLSPQSARTRLISLT